MSIPTKEEAQDKLSRKVDKALKKKTKRRPLSEESWTDLHQRGASLAEQYEWLKLDKKRKDRQFNG